MTAKSGRRSPPLADGPGILEALLTLGGLACLEILLKMILPASGPAWSAAALYRIAIVRALEIAILALGWRIRGFGLSDFGLDSARAAKGITIGMILSATLGGIAFGLEIFWRKMGWGSFLRQVSGPEVGDAYGALVLAGVVVAPIFEELVFRGLVYGALRRRWGVAPCMILSVALFALAHLPGGKIPWEQAVGGLVFCMGLELSGSLWAPILVHALGNLVLFSLPFLLGQYL